MTSTNDTTSGGDRMPAGTPITAAFPAWENHRDTANKLIAEYDGTRPLAERLAAEDVISSHFVAMGDIEQTMIASDEHGPDAARALLSIVLLCRGDRKEDADFEWDVVARALAALTPETIVPQVAARR